MIDDREERLRPGRCSQLGFLGEHESLAAVIDQDRRALVALGITHEQLATALDNLVATVDGISSALLAKAQGPTGEYFRRDQVGWFNPYDLALLPTFSQSNLPDLGTGYLVGGLHIFVSRFRGLQECPWGCEFEAAPSSMNFLVLDRSTTEYFTFPGLSPHLIRAHHFFEGFQTPFRTDPKKAATVLGLVAALAAHRSDSDRASAIRRLRRRAVRQDRLRARVIRAPEDP